MPTFTPEDLQNLADQCDDLADAIPIANFTDVNVRSDLFKRAQSLRGCAFDLRTVAATIVVTNTSVAIKDLAAKTKDVIAVINTLKDVAKTLALLDDTIALASAVATQRWGLLQPALAHLIEDTSSTAAKGGIIGP